MPTDAFNKEKYKSVAPHVVFFKEREEGLCDKPKW